MHPAERIAADTWERLKLSRGLKVRLGEETLTDLLVLDFVRSMMGQVELFQSTKSEESRQGTDLWILIHAGGDRAHLFAVQAKKLHESERYNHLNAKVKCSSQIDILEDFSRSARAIPYYLLYNYVRRNDIQPYWHCCQCSDDRQMGCTLVPSWVIRQAISKRGHRNFNSIHAKCAALPWRCLFDCPQGRSHRMLPASRRSLSMIRMSLRESRLATHEDLPMRDAQEYDWVSFDPIEGGWPDWLWSRDDGKVSIEDFGRIWADISSQDSQVSKVENRDESEFPASALPRHVILVKE